MQQHPLRIDDASYLQTFAPNSPGFERSVSAHRQTGTLCYHKKVPGVYDISALACSQGRGLEQQQCSGSFLGISRAGELMPSNPLVSLNMTSADRE